MSGSIPSRAIEENSSNEAADISNRTFSKLENSARKIGYADGRSDGRDSMYQQGFDIGYASGFKTAFALGRQLGRQNVEDSFLTSSQCQLCEDAATLSLPLAEIEKIHEDRHRTVLAQLSERYEDVNKRFQNAS